MYGSPLVACRLEAMVRRLALGGGGRGPDGGGAGRIGKTVVELKLSISFGRLGRPLTKLKASPSLGRSCDTTGLLDVRGGNIGRSKDGTDVG